MNRKRINILKDKSFALLGILATLFGLLMLMVLVLDISVDGISKINWRFLTGSPSKDSRTAGILPALVGSVYLILIMIIFAFPLGVGAAIYLEEYARKNWLTNLIELNVSNLAGVPSIIFGIIGLGIFVRTLGFGKSLLSGGLTLGLLTLPIIIISARESLSAIPSSFKEASYALGATKWQTVYHTLLPAAFPGILTGVIFAIARAMGEAAPLIVIGAAAYISFLPKNPLDSFTALPIQIYNWVSYPQKEFNRLAAASIIVLLILTIATNGLAIFLRGYFRKRMKW